MKASLPYTIDLPIGPGTLQFEAEVKVEGDPTRDSNGQGARPYAIEVEPYQTITIMGSPRLPTHVHREALFGALDWQRGMRQACLDWLNANDDFAHAASMALDEAHEDQRTAAAEARAEWRAA